MKRKIIFYILIFIFLSIFIVSGIQIYRIQSEYSRGVKEYNTLFDQAVVKEPDNPKGTVGTEDIKSNNPLGFNIDYDALYALNNDYIGWIYIPDTEITYPLVAYTDNDYYLHRTFSKEYNFAGTLFLDYLTNTLSHDNVIIYGHRMNNGSMFADLQKYLDQPFYEEHKNVYIFTKDEILIYEVFSSRIVGLEDDCYTVGFPSSDYFNSWVKDMKSRSRYPTTHTPILNNSVLTLSTCVKNNETSRIVIEAQLVGSYPLS